MTPARLSKGFEPPKIKPYPTPTGADKFTLEAKKKG